MQNIVFQAKIMRKLHTPIYTQKISNGEPVEWKRLAFEYASEKISAAGVYLKNVYQNGGYK